MSKQSAGILLYRHTGTHIEFFLVHPGGPFFAKKDLGSWSIPKGEFTHEEEALTAAKREFEEELGATPKGEFIALTPVKQSSGKTVHAWALEGDIDPEAITSNTFEIEWPPKSGKKQSFPEIDKGQWFPSHAAKEKINKAQAAFIDELTAKLAGR
jgi:predicted NUDIX family NTP pyrophosphohydrolase